LAAGRPTARYGDVPERVAQATGFLLRNVVKMQGAVRVMIASTITRDEVTFPRPGKQFGLIDLAVAPLERLGLRLHDSDQEARV
jgi:hypothetical protein